MKPLKYPSTEADARISAIIERTIEFDPDQVHSVTQIIEEIRRDGDAALIRYIDQFDSPGLNIDSLRVTEAEFQDALEAVEPSFLRALDRAITQIGAFHRKQLQNSWISTDRPGTVLGQMVHPVDAAGVYVPGGQGGKTPLVSSVLMTGIPAGIAGVGKVIMATPATREGLVNPHLLVAARKVGIDTVFKAGSAWAIAALAYGTATIPRTDVIVGPGNVYVTLAKKLVSGVVGIDMIAGPSEILVIADETAEPDFIAADLLSQAEHDILASSVLLTDSMSLAKAVADRIEIQIEKLARGEIARKSLQDYGAILVTPDIDTAITLANRVAPEHLELLIADPFDHIGKIRNAGAVFMGNYTPEPVGDYIAGPNHVLPTAGTARFSSALSVDHFMKKTSLISYSKAAFDNEADDIIRLAEIEGLDAHANSVRVRMGKTAQ